MEYFISRSRSRSISSSSYKLESTSKIIGRVDFLIKILAIMGRVRTGRTMGQTKSFRECSLTSHRLSLPNKMTQMIKKKLLPVRTLFIPYNLYGITYSMCFFNLRNENCYLGNYGQLKMVTR